MRSQQLRQLPFGMVAEAWWVEPDGTLTNDPKAASTAPWRPQLSIRWRQGKTLVLVLMNPSAATAEQLDATIRNALYYALRLDLDGKPVGRLFVANAYDIRATNLLPEEGKAEVQLEHGGERVELGAGLPLVSQHCDRLLRFACNMADLVICGWGDKVTPERTAELLAGPLAGVDLHVWRWSERGAFPKHPRGQRQDQRPSRWRPQSDGSHQLGPSTPHVFLRPMAERLSKGWVDKRRRQLKLYGLEEVMRTVSAEELPRLWRWA